jgi:hypothetical protein
MTCNLGRLITNTINCFRRSKGAIRVREAKETNQYAEDAVRNSRLIGTPNSTQNVSEKSEQAANPRITGDP